MPASVQDESRPETVPAPTGGWNASSPISQMSPRDAVFLDNLFPQASDVALRKGSRTLTTISPDTIGSPHNIRTLVGYSPPSGAVKIFAAAEDGLYDVTAGGTQLTVASAATNNDWHYVNISTAGGAFVFLCNGVDKCRTYNGTSWNLLDTLSTPALTGIVSTEVAHVSLHKTRIMMCVNSSLSFYHLDVNSIAGAATEFPLGALFKKGGYLVATASWTMDAGYGPDDYFVAITSEGEIAVYKGIDPTSAASWALLGIYSVAAPLNRRCFHKFGGDLLIMTTMGLFPLSKVMQSSAIVTAVTDKIHRAYTDYVQNYSTLFGWQLEVFPEGHFMLINVPTLNYTSRNIIVSYQFVMNLTTKAWCRFTDWSAECWLAFNRKLYFARNNVVYEAWVGTDDDGAGITAKAKTAFNYFRSQRNKQIALARPVFTSDGTINIAMRIDTDFADGRAFSTIASYVQTVTEWDTARFDSSTWSGGPSTNARWRTIAGRFGRAAAVRLRFTARGITMTWSAVDLLVKDGGML